MKPLSLGLNIVDKKDIDSFIRDINKYPAISKKEERELCKTLPPEELRKFLVLHNLKFVVSIANKYRDYGLPFQDLIQEGMLGLIKASETFNPAKNTKFITHSVWWIRKFIKEAIAQYATTVRQKSRRRANAENVETVYYASNDEWDSLSIEADPILSKGEKSELQEKVRLALSTLSKIEQDILCSCFGIDCNVVSIYGLSLKHNMREHEIREIKKSAMNKIRESYDINYFKRWRNTKK